MYKTLLFDFAVVNQQKQLDDWCVKKKATEGEQTEADVVRDAEEVDTDNTKTVEVGMTKNSVWKTCVN